MVTLHLLHRWQYFVENEKKNLFQMSYLDKFFYRATLCVSAVFAVARCLFLSVTSVRLYTLVDCIHVTEDIVKLLCWPDSSIILVFDSQRRYGQTDRQICYIDIALYMLAQADA